MEQACQQREALIAARSQVLHRDAPAVEPAEVPPLKVSRAHALGPGVFSEPAAEDVRRDIQCSLWQVQGLRQRNRMVEARPASSAKRVSNLASCTHRHGRVARMSISARHAAAERESKLAVSRRSRHPLVFSVRHDARTIVEDDFVTRAVRHDGCSCRHLDGTTVGAKQPIAYLNSAHRRPAGWRWQRSVESQGLANGRSRRDDNHLTGMQAVSQRIQVGESCRYSRQRAVAAADRLDLIQGTGHDLSERQVVLAYTPIGHTVYLSLCPIDKLVGVAIARIAELHDPGAHLDQSAEDRSLPDYPGVVASVGGRGHRRNQRVQVWRAAHPANVTVLSQLGCDRYRVRGLTSAVEVEDDLVHDLMCRPVVVMRLDNFKHVGDRVLGQHHAAEDTLLGGKIMRWRAFELLAPRRDLGDAHPAPPRYPESPAALRQMPRHWQTNPRP